MKKFAQIAAVAAVLSIATSGASFADDKKSDDPITGIVKVVETVVTMPIKILEDLSK